MLQYNIIKRLLYDKNRQPNKEKIMRKHIKAIFSCVCCLLLAFSTACGNPNGGNGNGNGSGNGNGNGGSGNGGGGGGGGGSHEGKLSVRGNIEELGENVDNVPYLGLVDEENDEVQPMRLQREVLDAKNASMGNGIVNEGSGTVENKPDHGAPQPGQNWGNVVDSIDVENPEDDIFYEAYAESRRYVSPCADLFYIGGANNALEFDVKYVKQNVFEHVTMLNRWIRWTDSTMLRMRYDQVNNVLSCEELSSYNDPFEGPYFHYHCTTSSYTPDGKEIIEYVSTQQRNIGDYKYSKFYRYIEDKEQLYFTVLDEDMYGVVYSDLSQENPLVTAFSYAKETYENDLYENITKEIFLPQTENDPGFAANITTQYINGELSSNYFQQLLINADGLNIGYINEIQNYSEEEELPCGATLAINLPYITNLEYSINFAGGIDVARFHEDWEYQENIRNYDYIDNNVTYDFNLGGLEFSSTDAVDDFPFEFGYGMLLSHALGVSVDNENDLLNYMEENNFILGDKSLGQVERFLTRNEFLSNNSIFGYSLDYEITADIIYDIFIRYISTFSHVSDEELQSYSIANALPMEQQTADEQYYLIYDVQFTGSISFDETDETVDISNIVATMPKNLALNGGETLALVAVYTTGCESYELARKTFTYNKEDLTMAFDDDAKAYIPEMNGEGQIVFYVVNVSNQSMRVSTVYAPVCDDKVDTLLVSGALIKRLTVENNALVIRQAEKYVFNPTIDGKTMANPINFVQACGAFVEGDYAVLCIMDGETLLASFNYYFNQNITPNSITFESDVNPDMLHYSLTICNANGGMIYSGNL